MLSVDSVNSCYLQNITLLQKMTIRLSTDSECPSNQQTVCILKRQWKQLNRTADALTAAMDGLDRSPAGGW